MLYMTVCANKHRTFVNNFAYETAEINIEVKHLLLDLEKRGCFKMMNILDYIPKKGYCSRLFVVGPYPMDTYIKKINKELSARQNEAYEIVVCADEAWNEDILEKIKEIPNTRVLLVKAGDGNGLVHAKMYFLDCVNGEGIPSCTLITGSGNATISGMTKNAEVMTVTRLAQFEKNSYKEIKKYFRRLLQEDCSCVEQVVAKFNKPIEPSAMILPPLQKADKNISFYNWLRSGYLFYKYEKDPNFGYIVITLEKPLPGDKKISRLLKKSIFNGDDEVHSLRYQYIKLEEIKEKRLRPSDYALQSDYGYWISRDCFKEKKDSIFQEKTTSNLSECVSKKRKNKKTIIEKVKKELEKLVKHQSIKQCVGKKIEIIDSIVSKKIERDFKMSKDENFVFRYKTGYAQHKMPDLDEKDFKEFLDSAMGSCLIKLNGNSVRNLFVQKLRDILDEYSKEFDEPEQLSNWLDKCWPKLYNQMRFYYKKDIAIIQQKYNTDCGIACVAMLVGKGYDTVMKKAKEIFSCNWGKDDNYRTNNSQIKLLISEFLPNFQNRFKQLNSWDDIQELCLASVRYNERKDTWHWVLVDRVDDDLVVYDPQKRRPVTNPEKNYYGKFHQYLPMWV